MGGKSNIVWLFPDQHRADVLGVAGHPVVCTPNIDRLASEGVLFESLYCQGPLCVPARVSLLTERYVRDHGAFENDYPASSALPTMVQAIRNAGYETVAIGKMHLFPHFPNVTEGLGLMKGFGFTEVQEVVGKLASGFVGSGYTDYLAEHGLLETYQRFVRERTPWLRGATRSSGTVDVKPTWAVDPSPLPAEHYLDTWVGDRAVEWIDGWSGGGPFFLWVGFPGPHDPWDAPAEYVERYQGSDIPLDSTNRPDVPENGPLQVFLQRFLDYSSSSTLTDERAREVRRHYFANVSLIDEAVGKILAALQRRGLDENTWLVYTTDHGEMLGTHGLLNKMVFYEPSVRVPLIVRPPGGCAPRRVNGLVEHVDLSATLRALAGAGDVLASAGRSFSGALTGSELRPREVVVSENFGFAMWRTERYKVVVYEKELRPVQLFDLLEDPEEETNHVEDPSYQVVLKDLMAGYVRPFLATPPVRPGPDLVERSGELRTRPTRRVESPVD